MISSRRPKEVTMNHRTLLAIAVGSALAAGLPCAYADGNQAGAAPSGTSQPLPVPVPAGSDDTQAQPATPQTTVPQEPRDKDHARADEGRVKDRDGKADVRDD